MEWRVSPAPVGYDAAVAFMEARVRAIREDGAEDCVWLLEHPPLYTAGTSAKPEDLLDARHPVHATGRGGQYTYHGPGQRVAYVMRDLLPGLDLSAHVRALEDWAIRAMAPFGVNGERREGFAGVWVGGDKIAAVGVRVRRGVAYHGLAVNRAPDLSAFTAIVPCGVRDGGVTSLAALGLDPGAEAFDNSLRRAHRESFFGNTL